MERDKRPKLSSNLSRSQCNGYSQNDQFQVEEEQEAEEGEAQGDQTQRKQIPNDSQEEDRGLRSGRVAPPSPDSHNGHHHHQQQIQSRRGRKKRKLKAVVEEEDAAGSREGVGKGNIALGRGRRSMGVSGSSESLVEGDSGNKKENQLQCHGMSEPVSGKLAEKQVATSIPERKLLELVLDKLQKKDKYEVFAEPVDPEEVPDYYDYIKNPMDFGTIRKKVAKGLYATLEQFEKDVFLICSNAMSYNASSTIYYRHARAIQELAKKFFEMLRIDPEKIELEHKSPIKSKSSFFAKKFANGAPSGKLGLESPGSDVVSGATLATNGNNENLLSTSLHGSAKLKKGDASERSGTGCEYSNGTGYQGHNSADGNSSAVDSKFDQSEDFSASALKMRAIKDGRRTLLWEEERRDTYRPRNLIANGDESIFAILGGESKRLLPIGIQSECPYAKSLARFAAELGPVARKIATQKIKRAWSAVVASLPQNNNDLKATSIDSLSVEKNKAQPKPLSSGALHINKDENKFSHMLASQLGRNEVFVRKGGSEGQLSQLTSTMPTAAKSAANCDTYQPSANCSSLANPQSVKSNYIQEPTTELPFEGLRQIDTKSGSLITPGTKFTSEVSQSKLLEIVSRNNRLMQWMPTKQADGGEPVMSFQVTDSQSVAIERGSPREIFSTSKLPTTSGSPNVAVATGSTSIRDCQDRTIGVCTEKHPNENFTAKGLNYLANSDKSKMFLPLQQSSLNTSVGTPQLSISSTGPTITQEYGALQPSVRSQNADMARLDASSRSTFSTIPIPSNMHLISQKNEPQVRTSSSTSQFMQQKMLLDMSSYIQSQLNRMNSQNLSTLAQNISDGHVGQIFEPRLSNRTVPSTNSKSLWGIESSQSYIHPSKVVHSQEHFQKISEIPHSVHSDINIAFQSPKSPVKQSSEMVVHSQQPDLALQL